MRGFKQISIFEQDFDTYEPYNTIYGEGRKIYPYVPSKPGSRYLEYLEPLEYYDDIFIAFSGGKDSLAALLYILDMGVPKEKITLLHHKIDGEGENKILEMDWKCTNDYCSKLAKALGLKIKFSWREDGMAGEIFRYGSSKPIYFEEIESDETQVTYGPSWVKSEDLKNQISILSDKDMDTSDLQAELKKFGYRYKFPAKTASLRTRWCSSALKVEVCDRLLRYSKTTAENRKVLLVDGIRREESSNRGRYNEVELHATNAPSKYRYVHTWRPIIEWSEKMVWKLIEKHKVRPHPVYYVGFNRCSCAFCIFSMPHHFATAKELMPDTFYRLVEIEKELGFTLDSKKDLINYVGNAKSCIPINIEKSIIDIVKTGQVPFEYIIASQSEEWKIPSGAYKGIEGGAC